MPSDPGLLNIKFETLANAQGDLAAAFAAAQATIDELKNKLAGGLSMWDSDARKAYDDAQNDWNKAFAHMASVLQQAHVHLGNANEMYQTVERQNTSIWKS